jgi:hypothetical protein
MAGAVKRAREVFTRRAPTRRFNAALYPARMTAMSSRRGVVDGAAGIGLRRLAAIAISAALA